MKKFYLFAIAALVCGTAAAEGRQQIASNLNLRQTNLKATEIQKNAKLSRKDVVKHAGEEGITKVEDFAGVWELSFFDLLEAADNTLELTIDVADAAAGELAITGWSDGGNFVVPATVNLETGIFSIPNNFFLGRDNYGDNCFFYIKSVDENYDLNDGATDVEASYGEIEDTAIIFPELDIWAIGDPADESLGWWFLSYQNKLSQPESYDPSLGWEDYGTATFEDGWIIPAMGASPADYPWTVNISKSTEVAGQYRIDAPYLSEDCPFAGGKEGYTVFNISDPEFVSVLPGFYSGFDNGSKKLYLFNIEGAYSSAGYDAEEIKGFYVDEITNWSNYANGVATIYNCCFEYSPSGQSLYTWLDENGNSLADMMVSKITFDMDPVSVGTIGAPAQNTVEFFNLQGMPVKNPAPGQLLIKRTANGAVKTIIR